MTPTREQLIDALVKEYEYLCHDDYDPDEDITPEEYLEMINTLSYDELVSASADDLEEYISTWL